MDRITIADRMRDVFLKLTSKSETLVWDFGAIDWGTVPPEIALKLIKSNAVPGYTTTCRDDEDNELGDGYFRVCKADLIGLETNNDVIFNKNLS